MPDNISNHGFWRLGYWKSAFVTKTMVFRMVSWILVNSTMQASTSVNDEKQEWLFDVQVSVDRRIVVL